MCPNLTCVILWPAVQSNKTYELDHSWLKQTGDRIKTLPAQSFSNLWEFKTDMQAQQLIYYPYQVDLVKKIVFFHSTFIR